ncbi:hypothetical protein CHH28_16085 [Bacterioplanes sanyensis]|uniref:Chemotaxis protein n=1 Tax=Bacterioplanes sanyensis TaxID=1249553 RepID=A0A222FMW9_9GAMM|nr:hypothetical protein [Bacterioplanes sanyensis]ASP40099.1 hypothetical protein CHH28_16085 [Bacterioplanes sanyensis]
MTIPIFVTAASIAAELHQAQHHARGLALTAKNARALAVRAGSKTVGFRAITQFIDELASDIIRQSQYINQLSEQVSQHAVALWRATMADNKVNWVMQQQSEFCQSLLSGQRDCRQRSEQLSEKLRRGLRLLEQELDESDKHIRTANLIATSSKVEAASAEEFRYQLEVIAESISATADRIRQHLSQARLLLSLR